MNTITIFALVCALSAGPAPQEEETREFRVFEGEDLRSITLLVQRKTGKRLMWTKSLGLAKKEVSFSLAKPVHDPVKIFQVYRSFLAMNDLVLVPVRGVEEGESYFKIKMAALAPKSALPLANGSEKPSDRFVSRVFRVRNASPRDIHAALINMVTYPQGILMIESAGIVLVSDYDYNIERMAGIIAEIDNSEGRDRVDVIQLENRTVSEIHPLLEDLVAPAPRNPEQRGRLPETAPIRVLADKETNSLVVRANPLWLEKIRRVVERLDRKK